MDRDDTQRDSLDTTKPPRTNNILRHDDDPGVGDIVGEAAGGFSGVFAGAAIGSVGGPIGAIIGSIAGAVGGWWTGRTVSEAATHLTRGDTDTEYRTHYESASAGSAGRSYDDVRPAYQLGHLAGMNPEYHGRDFDTVEPDLQRGWSDDVGAKHGEWQSVRSYARDAFERSRSGAQNVGHGIANAVDDVKDRVDGNPASQSGPDATDSPRRL